MSSKLHSKRELQWQQVRRCYARELNGNCVDYIKSYISAAGEIILAPQAKILEMLFFFCIFLFIPSATGSDSEPVFFFSSTGSDATTFGFSQLVIFGALLALYNQYKLCKKVKCRFLFWNSISSPFINILKRAIVRLKATYMNFILCCWKLSNSSWL